MKTVAYRIPTANTFNFFQLSGRRKMSPVSWYVNNGYNPGQKENPVFVDTINDANHSSFGADHHRRRAVFSDIHEEGDRAKSFNEMMDNMNEMQNIKYSNGLDQVCVEVERKCPHGTSCSKSQDN